MNKTPDWTVPKLPFWVVFALLIVTASVVVAKAAVPFSNTAILEIVGCVVAGAMAACLPYILEYYATSKLVELNSLGTVAEQLGDLKRYAEQISTATNQWALVQETTKGNADKTVAAAKEVAARMAEEIREFNEFQVKLNDTEKGALRLEVEKLRRAEAEWLQVVVRILDHIYALHNAAHRSGNMELAAQIGNFQNACRDAARRVGLASFTATSGDKFEPQKHRAHGIENPPAESVIAETLAPGMTFQGRLLRPALVRLQDANAQVAEPAAQPAAEPTAESSIQTAAEPPPPKTETADPGEFSLEAN